MTAMATPRHRVSVATAQLRGLATDVSDASVWSMSAEETGATLVELTRLEAQICELRSRVAAHADEIHVGREVGASSAANWLAHETRQTRSAAHRTVRLGHQLAAHQRTRAALASGAVSVEQAQVVVRVLEELPDDLDADRIEEAEARLLDLAGEHDAKDLRRLGKRLWEVARARRGRRP